MNKLPWPIGEYVYHIGTKTRGAVIRYDSRIPTYTILLDHPDDQILIDVAREEFKWAERQDSKGAVMDRHATMHKLQENLISRLDWIDQSLDALEINHGTG